MGEGSIKKNSTWGKNTGVGARLVRSTAIVLAVTMATGIAWNIYFQKKQALAELLEQSRILAAQTLALREVMAQNQARINYDSKGNFEFKHLNPAAVVKQVASVFNAGTDYRIRQVSLRPRVAQNTPDEGERAKLLRFEEDPDLEETWEEIRLKDEKYFRYMVPLRINSSCLPCHGEPKGEPDVSGHPREGYRAGALAGALVIAIPMKMKEASLNKSITQTILLTIAAIVFSAGVIIYHANRFVAKPIESLTRFAQRLGQGDLSARPEEVVAFGEIRELTDRFADMAQKLQELYDNMDQMVRERTAELARANREMERANRELARVSQYKSEFLANMSHELRTPLTAILAFTGEILDKNPENLDREQREYLHDIKESGHQLLGLINDLLDLSKIESGKMSLKLMETDVGELAVNVEKLLRPLAVEKGIEIRTEVRDTEPVIADREKVRQVIQNLLGNAIKFSPAGSAVELEVCGEPEGPGEGRECSGGVIVRVRDRGPGIPPGEKERIFDVFYQYDRGLTRQVRGTGLGLALVKKIVETHRGRVEVESSEGGGSVFTVFWPSVPMLDEDLE